MHINHHFRDPRAGGGGRGKMINISQFKVQYLQLIYKNLKYQTKNRCNAFLLLEYLGFRKSGGNYSMKQLCHSLKWLNGKH